MSRSRWFQFGILLLATGWNSVIAQNALPAKVLTPLKSATVYIKCRIGGNEQTGSGFLWDRRGPAGTVVTNAHVIDAPAGRSVDVVFFSGTSSEHTVQAEVLAEDKKQDIAFLKVAWERLPAPINRLRTEELSETLPIYAIGFPFGEELAARRGGPEITVSPSAISSLRKDDHERLVAIQLTGGLNPGNSGGPVVDSDGALVGIAVAKVIGTEIGLVIPAETLAAMVNGRVSRTVVTRTGEDKGVIELKFDLKLSDPLSNVQRASVLLLAKRLHKESEQEGEGGQPPALEPMKGAREYPLKLSGERAAGTVKVITKDGKLDHLFQIKLVRKDRTIALTLPADVVVFVGTPDGQGPAADSGEESSVDKESSASQPSAEAKETVTRLPAPIEDLWLADSGRLIVLKPKDIPGLIIYDLVDAKIARTIRLPSSEFQFAAGGANALIYFKEDNLLQTWDISTGEKRNTKPNPWLGPLSILVMGYARGDQAFVLRHESDSSRHVAEFTLLNVQTLEPSKIELQGCGAGFLLGSRPIRIRSNRDLSRITHWETEVSPCGVNLLSRQGDTYQCKREHDTAGYLIPADDGRVYTGVGRIYTGDLTQVATIQDRLLFPGVGGSLILGMNDSGAVEIFEPGKKTSIGPCGEFNMGGRFKLDTRDFRCPGMEKGVLPWDKRVIFAPMLERLAYIPLDSDRVVSRRFDLKATLDGSGTDYLVVTSIPSCEVKPKEAWKYQTTVLSKKGGPKYSLEFAPSGMKVSGSGLITWTVPASLGDQGEKVVLLITDAGGAQTYHTFTLRFARSSGSANKQP